MHSSIKSVFPAKAVGQALTVQLSKGDLVDPLKAVEMGRPGDLIVVDTGEGDTDLGLRWGRRAQPRHPWVRSRHRGNRRWRFVIRCRGRAQGWWDAARRIAGLAYVMVRATPAFCCALHGPVVSAFTIPYLGGCRPKSMYREFECGSRPYGPPSPQNRTCRFPAQGPSIAIVAAKQGRPRGDRLAGTAMPNGGRERGRTSEGWRSPRTTAMLVLPPCSRSGSKTALQAAHQPACCWSIGATDRNARESRRSLCAPRLKRVFGARSFLRQYAHGRDILSDAPCYGRPERRRMRTFAAVYPNPRGTADWLSILAIFCLSRSTFSDVTEPRPFACWMC